MNINRIILIDDNRVDNLVNKRILNSCSIEAEILVFENPLLAFQWFCTSEGSDLEKAKSSLILLDINMPELNGFQLLDKLENEHPSGFPNYLVLMLTSSADIADQIRASSYNRILGYFHKPLTPKKINDSLLPLVGTLFGKAC